jgi:hypothetical protein
MGRFAVPTQRLRIVLRHAALVPIVNAILKRALPLIIFFVSFRRALKWHGLDHRRHHIEFGFDDVPDRDPAGGPGSCLVAPEFGPQGNNRGDRCRLSPTENFKMALIRSEHDHEVTASPQVTPS